MFRELTCDGIKTMADKNSYSQCLAPILVPCGPSFEFRSQFYTDHEGTSSNQNRSLNSTYVSLDFTFFFFAILEKFLLKWFVTNSNNLSYITSDTFFGF